MQQCEKAAIPILYSVHLKPCNKPNENIISDTWSMIIKKCAYVLHEHTADASHQWWAESLRMEDKIINRYVIESTGILIFTSNLSSWFNISVSIHSRVSQRLLECQNVYLLQSTVTLERLGFSQWFNNQTWSAGADIIKSAIQQNWSLNGRMLLGSFWNQKNQL